MSARRAKAFMSEAEMLEAVRARRFDAGNMIPTFRQFDGAVRRRWARENGGHPLDTYQWATDDAFRVDYGRYVAGRFERGAALPWRVWRTLDEASKTAVLGTRRAQYGRLRSGGKPSMAPLPALTRQGDPVFPVP